ncbi:MAG TPA: Yip1 family protein [Bacillota bacterium]|nr:Yip1 family protein [Bacillota bacterium]
MKCSQCGHEQAEGMFCGLCGGELVANNVEERTTTTDESSNVGTTVNTPKEGAEQIASTTPEQPGAAPQASNETHQQQAQPQGGQAGTQPSTESLDRVVETSKEFGNFFQQFMKMPSQAFTTGSQQFTHAIINLAILAVVFSVTIYRMLKVDISSIHFEFGSYAFNAFLTISVSMLTIIVVIFAMNKLLANESITFENVVTVYGVFMVPAVILNLIALVFAILKNTTYAGYFLVALFLLVILIIPLYMIGYFVTNYRKNIDPLYAYLLYVVLSAVALIIVNSIVLDSVTGDFVDYMYDQLTTFLYFLIG